MEFIYWTVQPFIWHPERAWTVAVLFAAVFGVGVWRRRHGGGRHPWVALVPALGWFGFGWLELIAKQERADIRIDLLVTWPVLLGITVASGLWLWWDFTRSGPAAD